MPSDLVLLIVNVKVKDVSLELQMPGILSCISLQGMHTIDCRLQQNLCSWSTMFRFKGSWMIKSSLEMFPASVGMLDWRFHKSMVI